MDEWVRAFLLRPYWIVHADDQVGSWKESSVSEEIAYRKLPEKLSSDLEAVVSW